jgi:mono/diheme cytochrome c family protein
MRAARSSTRSSSRSAGTCRNRPTRLTAMKRNPTGRATPRGGSEIQLATLALFLGSLTLAGCAASPEAGSTGSSSTPTGYPGHDPGMMGGGYGMMGGPGMMGGYGMSGGRGMMRGYGASTGSAPVAQGELPRHRQVATSGVPAPYRGMVDPLPNTATIVDAGRNLYAANCAACHGPQGEGNGPAGAWLSPPAANLRTLVHSPIGQDDYLMWAISTGGAAYGTAMPGFQGSLPEDARWKIVRYLKTL